MGPPPRHFALPFWKRLHDAFAVQVVLEVLLAAHKQGKRFRVVVVDGRPELEGRQMLRCLLQVRLP